MATLPMESPGPSALQGLGRLAPWRRIALLVALAATIAVGVAAALWLQRPSLTPLRGTFSHADLGEAADALERATIPFELGDGGLLLVRPGRVQAAEMALSEAGVRPAAGMGLDEVLKPEQGIGTSRETTRAKLKRALEIELARTISSMKPVSAARVHLAIPRRSAFVRAREEPGASVILDLRQGRRLSEGQVDTIRHLVAQAVDGLSPDAVVISDSAGTMLGKPAGPQAVQAEQLAIIREIEAARHQKIVRLLTPIAGPGGFTAEVSAEVDFTRVETASTDFNADDPAVRSRVTTEEENAAGPAAGVPGALSNQPPAAASAPEEAAPAGAAGNPAGNRRRRRSSTTNHEVDREVRHVLQVTPQVTHLSVAVVLDDQRQAGPEGTVARRPWTPEQLNRIEAQVKSAIGYSLERGDTVSVTNTRFAPPVEIEPLPEPPLWQQPWLWDLVRQVGAGLLGLLLVFGVLKPIMRTLVNRDLAEAEAGQASEQARLSAAEERVPEAAAPHGGTHAGALPLTPGPGEFERNLDAVRELVSENPRRAANVVKEWVAENG